MMKKQTLLYLSLLAAMTLPHLAEAADQDLHFNGLGFLPEHVKRVSVTTEETVDTVLLRRASDDETVKEIELADPVVDSWTNVQVYNGDFSDFDEPGVYYLEIPDFAVSRDFPISETAFDPLFENAMRGFYGWRSGADVSLSHNGQEWAHNAGHLEDGYLDYVGEPEEQKDGTGGWYDAGDYGKYTINGAFAAGMMLAAWEDFTARLETAPLDIPETGGDLPDFLAEVKWELDWLLKMQFADGSVSHKLTSLSFSGFVMPEDHGDTRYFTPYSTAATADFAAIMAKAARIYEPYDEEFAATCLEAAELSFAFILDNEDNVNMADNLEGGFSPFRTGGYDSLDGDDRIWAAAELFETTGNADALELFETRASASSNFIATDSFDWGNVKNLGTFVYLNSTREERDESVVDELESQILDTAAGILNDRDANPFGRGLRSVYWGSNGTVLRMCMILRTANHVEADAAYADACIEQIDHMYGRNYYGRSQVTGDGYFPPCNPHDRRSGADGITPPYPGLLVGGGSDPTNWVDVRGSYETNEVAINWNGALVYALAGFVTGGADPSVDFEAVKNDCTETAPPPPPQHVEDTDTDTDTATDDTATDDTEIDDTESSDELDAGADAASEDSDGTPVDAEASSGGCSCNSVASDRGGLSLIWALLS